MAGFLLALIAILVAGIGARDQVLVAALAVQGKAARPAVLLVALGCAGVTAALAAWAAGLLMPLLGGDARLFYAALALGLAGAEMMLARRRKTPLEPTHSLGAFGFVLFVQQLTDAARFLLLGIALAAGAPLAAGLGGAIGGAVVVTAGWLAGDDLLRRDLAPLRRALGALALALALWLALRAMGRI